MNFGFSALRAVGALTLSLSVVTLALIYTEKFHPLVRSSISNVTSDVPLVALAVTVNDTVKPSPDNAAASRLLPLCPVSATLVGEWYLPPEHLWMTKSCVATSTDARNDCRERTDPALLSQWNWTDSYWKFRPYDCALTDYSTQDELRRILLNRTILFMGDSLSHNHYTDALCEFHQATGGKVEYVRGPESRSENLFKFPIPPFLYPSLNLTIKSVEFSRAFIRWDGGYVAVCFVRCAAALTPTISYILPFAIRRFGLMGHRNVIVINKGQHGGIEMGPEVDYSMKTMVNYTRMPDSPLFLWRETFPQHFSSNTGGYTKELLKYKCAPVDPMASFRNGNFRNVITNALADRNGLYTLRVHRPTVERWREHHGQYSAREFDCTHFCVPSSTMRFATQLMLHHMVLLRP